MDLIRRPLAGLALILLATLLAGCETGQALRPQPTPDTDAGVAARFAPWSETAPPAYRIGEGDRLRVMFPRTPEMEEEVLVRPDGVITLKAADEVRVADLTTAEAAQLIARQATIRLREPEVTISVTDPASARIYVGGEVRAPGVFRIAGPLTAIEALQLAGGATSTALIERVILLRRGPRQQPMLRLIDTRALLQGMFADNPRVLPGDILFVPRTRIAELGLWVEQFIDRVVPFQRSFNYTLGRTTNTTGNGAF